MDSKFKYDLALSLSAGDTKVADKLSEALTAHSIDLPIYYYRKERGSQYGANLAEKSIEVYMNEARHVLLLASKNYQKGEWAEFEWKLIKAQEKKRPYRFLLVIRLDNTRIKGLSEDLIFEHWKKNPYELANLIKEVIDTEYEASQKYFEEKHQKTTPPPLPEPAKSKWFKWPRLGERTSKLVNGLIVTVLGALIVHWILNFDWVPPPPSTGTCLETHYDLDIEAPRHANKGVYINSSSAKISSLDNTGRAQLQGISICDTLYLGTGRLRSNRIIITQTHINEGTIIYNGN